MTAVADVAPISPGWLRGGAFDGAMIVGVAVLAIACGSLAAYEPDWFMPLLLADLWLLGYHHVVTTFTRLCFDRESLRTQAIKDPLTHMVCNSTDHGLDSVRQLDGLEAAVLELARLPLAQPEAVLGLIDLGMAELMLGPPRLGLLSGLELRLAEDQRLDDRALLFEDLS